MLSSEGDHWVHARNRVLVPCILVALVLVGVSALGLFLFLRSDASPFSTARVIEANWGVDVPDEADATWHEVSDSGIQGDGWRATVFDVPESSRRGVFADSLFANGSDPEAEETAQRVEDGLPDTSGLPAPPEDMECAVAARSSVDSGTLVTCRDPGSSTYVVYEDIL
jgi:hypothetical protein